MYQGITHSGMYVNLMAQENFNKSIVQLNSIPMKKTIHAFLLFLAYVCAVKAQTFNDTYTISDLAANKGKGKFTFFNFDSREEVAVSDSNSTKWHIAFSGTTIIFNGGEKGPGVVAAQIVTTSTFDAITEVPSAPYNLTVISGSGSWYTYNPGTNNSGPHTIIPIGDKIIVVKRADGIYAKLQLLNYYKGVPSDVPSTGAPYTGTGQYYTFRYVVSDPLGTFNNTRTISDLPANKGRGKFTFFNFASGKEVVPADSNSTKWDIAFSSTTIIFNSGTKGPGVVVAQIITPIVFDELAEAPGTGYELNNISGSGSWYTYYPGSDFSGPHTIKPNVKKIIAAKLSDGRFVKVEILNYYQGAPADVPTTGASYEGIGQYYTFRYLLSVSDEESVEPTSVFTPINKTIKIFPNPISSAANTLSIVSEIKGGTIRIVDALGNTVYADSLERNESQLTNVNLARGFYAVLVESNGTIYHQKLIVE